MIDINEIRKLCDKATPGPWKTKKNCAGSFVVHGEMNNESYFAWLCSRAEPPADFEFIAKSREIIPELLDELEAVKSELCQCCNAFSDATGHGWNENCEVCKYRPMYSPKGESHE